MEPEPTSHIAIIGAGVAGLAAARAMRQRRPDLTIIVYERELVLGGRVATSRQHGYCVDHGAQYAKAPTPALEHLLTTELADPNLHDIGRAVWVFDHRGTISEGDPTQNADPKWTYQTGLDRLAALLAQGIDVRCTTAIGAIRQALPDQRSPRTAPRYALFTTTGELLGTCAALLLAIPAPEAAALIATSDLPDTTTATLMAELGRAHYRRCISIALAYERRITRPYYALVNSDRTHPIAWLAFEHDKGTDRCPPDQSLLIVQMAAHFSHDSWELPDQILTHTATTLASTLLAEPLPAPVWADVRRWPHALPDTGADFHVLNHSQPGLFFAGDYTADLGRVHLAIERGWRVAALIDRAQNASPACA